MADMSPVILPGASRVVTGQQRTLQRSVACAGADEGSGTGSLALPVDELEGGRRRALCFWFNGAACSLERYPVHTARPPSPPLTAPLPALLDTCKTLTHGCALYVRRCACAPLGPATEVEGKEKHRSAANLSSVAPASRSLPLPWSPPPPDSLAREG